MISIIVVNYKKSDLTVGLARSLVRLGPIPGLRLVIVDNDSTPESREGLRPIESMDLKTEFIYEKQNHGYFGGARKGLEAVKQKWPSDWVIISNSDIEFTDPEFFTQLAKENPSAQAGLLAPRVLSGLSGRDQNPYMRKRPTASRMQFYKWMFRYRITCFLYQMAGLVKSLTKSLTKSHTKSVIKSKLSSSVTASPQREKIYAAHGSFLIFSKNYFDKGGDFAHRPFLFGEEVTVAERCRQLNLEVIYEPQLVVSHIEHATMGWIPSSKMLKFQREASEYCADTFFSTRTQTRQPTRQIPR